MPRSGRKPKLTPLVSQAIARAVEAGVPVVEAAALAGIGKSTVLAWLQEDGSRHPKAVYQEFRDAVKKAKAQDEARRIARINQAGQGGFVTYEKTTTFADGRVVHEVKRTAPEWTADAWHLERSNPDRWGRRERHDLRLSIEQLAARVAQELGIETAVLLAEAQALLHEGDTDQERRWH